MEGRHLSGWIGGVGGIHGVLQAERGLRMCVGGVYCLGGYLTGCNMVGGSEILEG